MIKSENLINKLIEESDKIKIVVKKEFSELSFDSLNFRNEKYAWSPAECFDHLITTNNQYLPIIEAALEKGKNGSHGDSEFKTTFAGRFLLHSVNPDNMKKNKTPRLFRPEIRLYTREVIKSFLEQHSLITGLIHESKNKNIASIKVHSPVTRLLRFNLGECYQIIIYHNWRHIRQAGRILNFNITYKDS
jgi:hypothetical protein